MFLYVMDTESRDKLLNLGFELLKENGKKTVWVFLNKSNQTFDMVDVPCVISNILTF